MNCCTLMRLEHLQTQRLTQTCSCAPPPPTTTPQNTLAYTHPSLIPIFSSLFHLLSSLILPLWPAKLSPKQLNNHRGFQLAKKHSPSFLFFILFILERRDCNGTPQQLANMDRYCADKKKSVRVFVSVLMIPQRGGGNRQDDILCLKSPVLLAARLHADFKAPLNCEEAQSDTKDLAEKTNLEKKKKRTNFTSICFACLKFDFLVLVCLYVSSRYIYIYKKKRTLRSYTFKLMS